MSHPVPDTVYLALRRACMKYPFDVLIEMCTFSDLVHSEIRLGPSCSYAAYRGSVPCFLEATPVPTPHPDWVVFVIPVTDFETAANFVHEIRDAKLPYRFPWDCGVPQCVLREVDTDLDCTKPTTWGSIFCSQSSLLFLRRCAKQGILPTTLDTAPLYKYDSNGVSPAHIYDILEQMGIAPLPPDT